ncbi:hypothetical protein T03_1506 [Trichinella britovi]|uniref:Uncharacterized protein n=1 Tax=Trichinella britovi TaxID=45882 RepID=A0A0V1CWH5_TRIBR|nr:hypothetical protein T03_1506 [Trichinella britovi]
MHIERRFNLRAFLYKSKITYERLLHFFAALISKEVIELLPFLAIGKLHSFNFSWVLLNMNNIYSMKNDM